MAALSPPPHWPSTPEFWRTPGHDSEPICGRVQCWVTMTRSFVFLSVGFSPQGEQSHSTTKCYLEAGYLCRAGQRAVIHIHFEEGWITHVFKTVVSQTGSRIDGTNWAPSGQPAPTGNGIYMVLKSVVMSPRILHRNFQKSGGTELASMHRKEKIKLIIFLLCFRYF